KIDLADAGAPGLAHRDQVGIGLQGRRLRLLGAGADQRDRGRDVGAGSQQGRQQAGAGQAREARVHERALSGAFSACTSTPRAVSLTSTSVRYSVSGAKACQARVYSALASSFLPCRLRMS